MRNEDDARMSAALDYLDTYIADICRESENSPAVVVMLNEMTAGDLRLIKLAGWVREGYDITDARTVNWETDAYGEIREYDYLASLLFFFFLDSNAV